MDIAGLQHDRQSEHLADAAHGLQPMELLTQPAFGEDRPLEESDLHLQAAHHRHIGFHGTLLILKQRQPVNRAILQALDIVALE